MMRFRTAVDTPMEQIIPPVPINLPMDPNQQHEHIPGVNTAPGFLGLTQQQTRLILIIVAILVAYKVFIK